VVGDNGAGRPPLIKFIAAGVRPTTDSLFLEDGRVGFPTPVAAAQAGVVRPRSKSETAAAVRAKSDRNRVKRG
jgi:ABC-type antimicrobial peptide transport system ATPase subunit